MDFRLSRHAEWEMTRRGVPLALVQAAMDQSRVVVAEDEQPPVIITAYRTRKIEKYWRTE
ncbi:MAG: hypothetical protein ABSF98_16260 [Bryobacteraceae bacterium]|jgi:hypothetical protein